MRIAAKSILCRLRERYLGCTVVHTGAPLSCANSNVVAYDSVVINDARAVHEAKLIVPRLA
jgi:hypothetical protein